MVAPSTSPYLNSPTPSQLREFVPIYTLDPERIQELAKHARCIKYPAGSKLFSLGDEDNYILYLNSGLIELSNPSERMTITAGSESARLPLDPHQPRQYNAVVVRDAEFIVIERNLMDILLTWNPFSGYLVEEIAEDAYIPDDWMSSVLQSPVFQHIPPINIQMMFQKLETCTVSEHEVIFLQGDPGDYFYLIQQGSCAVIQSTGIEDTVIAELKSGQSFGEDALLSNTPRNATVIMKTDGVLLRLSKTDFDNLIKQPVVELISLEQAEALTDRDPQWIDVRQPEEHYLSAIEGSVNIPLSRLRENLPYLSKSKPYVVYCDNGHRSSCAVYMLTAYGYEAYVLENGVQSQTTYLD